MDNIPPSHGIAISLIEVAEKLLILAVLFFQRALLGLGPDVGITDGLQRETAHRVGERVHTGDRREAFLAEHADAGGGRAEVRRCVGHDLTIGLGRALRFILDPLVLG